MLMYRKGSKTGITVDHNQVKVLEKAGWSKTPHKEVAKQEQKPVVKATASTTTKPIDKTVVKK